MEPRKETFKMLKSDVRIAKLWQKTIITWFIDVNLLSILYLYYIMAHRQKLRAHRQKSLRYDLHTFHDIFLIIFINSRKPSNS